MAGELGRFVPQPSQVDDLAHAGLLCGAGDVQGGGTVDRLEVGRAERVDEVDGDVDTVEGGPDLMRVGDVGHAPANVRRGDALVSRDGDDLVARCERRHERPADHAGGTDDRDPHRAPDPAARCRKRPAAAAWTRRWSVV